MLCFRFFKHTPFPSPPTISQDQKTDRKEQAKLLPCHNPIITRSHVREMSTSITSLLEETTQEVALLKEQMVEMMRMMQQLFVG